MEMKKESKLQLDNKSKVMAMLELEFFQIMQSFNDLSVSHSINKLSQPPTPTRIPTPA